MPADADSEKTAAVPVIAAGTVVQQFKVVERIGAGGMGEVYLAQDCRLNRKVALKLLPATLAAEQQHVARFVREAQAAARLNHPNIIVIHEVGEFNSRPFFAMELVEGGTLHTLMQQKTLPVEEITEIAKQIAEGLAHAHSLGVTHRDIKPGNIVLTGDGRVKILDFGLADVAESDEQTKDGVAMGTIGYMSPEQLKGHVADHRSDLFSFGVLLYEMLAGKQPFRRSTDAATMQAILNEPAEPLARYRADLADGWQHIVTKALQRDHTLRYQTAADMLADIRRLSQQPSISTVVSDSRPVLAVLPFENIGSSEDDYFGDGITDEITSRLARLPDLAIISYASARMYKNSAKRPKDIGRELGAANLLLGSIRWDRSSTPARVRINTKLVQVSDETYHWAESYDRVLDQIFVVQSDIAENVARALGVTFSGKPQRSTPSGGTTNMEAYEEYLKGAALYPASLAERDIKAAIEHFQKAISIDPFFAQPYARLGGALTSKYYFIENSVPLLAQARNAFDKAFELAPGLVDAHVGLGYWYYHGRYDYEHALEQFELALEKQPNYAIAIATTSFVHRRQGKWEQAITELMKAIDLDPLNPIFPQQLAISLSCVNRYDEALEYIQRAIWAHPKWGGGYAAKAITIGLMTGELKAAAAVIGEALTRVTIGSLIEEWDILDIILAHFDNDPQRLLDQFGPQEVDPAVYLVCRGRLYGILGKREAMTAYIDGARVLIEKRLEENPNNDQAVGRLGVLYALLGDRGKAVEYTDRALKLRPLSIDSFRGPDVIEQCARVCTILGDFDCAVEHLKQLLSTPSLTSPAWLRVLPAYRPLHGHAGFRELVGL